MSLNVALAFLLSGFAGLMHEIVWSKLLASLIGTTAHAQAAVLVVYMGGLALGSVIFGTRADRRGRSLRTYLWLELAIAAYCLALPLFLGLASEGYVWAAGHVFDQPRLKLTLRFAFALLCVVTPAVMMGGTLPLLARHVIGHPGQVRRRVAVLYTLNNVGAVAGAAAAGFLTLPWLGVYASLVAASAMNVVAALLVWPRIADGDDARPPAATTVASVPVGDAAASGYGPAAWGVALAALFLSGFAAMAYEVVFIRVIALAFGATTYSFTVMLMCFIAGIGLGSLVVATLRVERPLWLLGASQLGAALAFLAATPLMERLPYFVGLARIAAHRSDQSFALYQAGQAALCLAVLLIPTMCVGAGFPLVAAVQARRPDRIGALVGSTYACNTVGNVLGILVTTLILLPSLGMLGSFHVAVAFSVAAGVLVLALASEAPAAWRTGAVAVTAAGLVVYAAAGRGWSVPLVYGINHMRLREGPPVGVGERVTNHPAASFAAWKRNFVIDPTDPNRAAAILHLEEEAHANVLVVDVMGGTRLVVNTKTDASTSHGDLETQILLAHVPLFAQPRARDVLVVGYGSGVTVGSALQHPIERADVVEISRGVLDVDPAFAAHNHGALSDPRVAVHIDDAQSFLRTVPRRYDVIISEPSNPWISGIAGLFTVEFFEVARAKLEPGGVFAMWFHEYEQSDAAIALMLRTFQSVFPHVTLFAEERHDDIIAIGAVEPLRFDFAAMEDRFDRPAVRADLARLGIANLATLLSHHAVPPARVAAMAGDGPLNSSLQQLLEYMAIRAMFVGAGSDLVERHSPFLHGETGVLLDDYMAFRERQGEPLRGAELDLAARHMHARSTYPDEHMRAFETRAERTRSDLPAATRPARGGE